MTVQPSGRVNLYEMKTASCKSPITEHDSLNAPFAFSFFKFQIIMLLFDKDNISL